MDLKLTSSIADALQYLNWQQYRALLQVIVREEASLLIDGTYVQQALFKAVQDQEHERTPLTRQNLLGFVISHAEAWHSIPARIGLFSTVQRLVEEKRTTLFQPFVTECTEKRSTFSSEPEKEGTEYWKFVLKGLKARSLSDDAMQLAKQVLNTTGQETLEIALRAEFRRAIQSWMLPAANSAQRLVLYETILSLIERQDPQVSSPPVLLSKLLTSFPG